MSIFEKSKEGLTTTTYHDDGKQCVVERNINYKPIIEHNKKLFTHNDGIDEYRNPKAVGSSIGKGEGIVKNYIQMGKTPSIIQAHTPPFEWKTMMGKPVKASRRKLRQRSK